MKLIDSKVEIIEQQPGLDGVYKQVELAGRTCYRSSDKITEDSAKEFVDRMINSKHGAMLEHGTVYLKITGKRDYENQCWEFPIDSYYYGFMRNKYSQVREIWADDAVTYYITTNLRVIIENGFTESLKYICEPTEHHEKRITVRFTCDRGVSHEIVRHRVMSFAQESQRYVGYDKEKFGGEVTFVKPHWYDEEFPACLTWIESLKESEKKYLELREAGLKPQDARGVLPNATKTEIVVTGFESDWEHFFELRTAKSAHPDCVKLAVELKQKLIDNGYKFNGNLENN